MAAPNGVVDRGEVVEFPPLPVPAIPEHAITHIGAVDVGAMDVFDPALGAAI